MNDFKKKIRENAAKMGDYEKFIPKNENNSNRPQRSNFTKKKPTPVTYVLTTGTMSSAIGTILDIVPQAGAVFTKAVTEYNVATAVADVAAAAQTMLPSLEDRKYIHTAVSLSVNRASIRFEGNVGFSWDVRYAIIGGKAEVTEVTLRFTLYDPANQSDIIEKLESDFYGAVKEERRVNKNK